MKAIQAAIVIAVVFAAIHWEWFEGPGSGLAAFVVGGWLAYATTCVIADIKVRSTGWRWLRAFRGRKGVD